MGSNAVAAFAAFGGLTSLTYRSRAAAPMSVAELGRLERASKARNRLESVTGLIVYEEGQFFQWLEGPVEGLSRIWESVSHDPRHTEIEIVAIQSAPARVFSGMDMKVLRRGAPRRRVAELRATLRAELKVDPRAIELAHLLLAHSPADAAALAQALYAHAGSLARASERAFEPAARGLGDMWAADDCTHVDVTLALCRLQAIVRDLGAGAPALMGAALPAVLVAPVPGEVHMLGATIDSELLWQAGWDAHVEFPATDDDLQAAVAAVWFDALDLELSAALRRDEWLPRMATSIARAKRASLNPALVVHAGGRIFVEERGAGARVGADATSLTASGVAPSIQAAMRRPRLLRAAATSVPEGRTPRGR